MALTTNSNHTVLRGGGQGGHLYDGIEPIVVNNQEYKISANTAALGVESPLYFSVDTSSQTVISFSGDAQPYSAGENISVNNHVISGRDWSPELAEKLDITALENLDVTEYSAGDNINISNHIVSGKDWNPEINNASSYAYSQAVVDMLKFPSAVDNITPNIVTGYISGSELHLSGYDWTDDITAASANAYNEAVNNITAVKSADSATYDNLGREITSTYLTAEVEYSAGANIDITNHVVSGKDWSSEISDASANAVNEAINQITAVASANSATYDSDGNKITETYISAHQDVSNLPYVQNSALEYTPGGHLVSSISGDGLYAMSADGAFTAETANYSYVAETANYVADGWEYNESDEITGYSGSAIHSEAGGEGKIYTGVAPIVVDNSQTTGVISAQTARLGVQGPLYFVEDTSASTVIGISGLPEVEGLMYESALNFSDGYITGYNNSAFSAERANYAKSATSANGAVSSQTAAIVTGGWETANGKITGYNGTAFSAGSTYDVKASSNISVATAGTTFTVSGKDWQNTITAASSYAYNQATANDKTYNVTAGANINVSTAGNTFGVSGKDWTNTITGASSYAYNQATANATGKYIPYASISTGDSGTQVYNVNKGIRVTATSGWVEMYNQNKENENEAHLQVGQNYADGHSFWAELDGAGGGSLQMNWNSGTIAPNAHSSYSNETTASLDIAKGRIRYYEGEQVDGERLPVWSIDPGIVQLWDYNGDGSSANYGCKGFEIYPTAGAMYRTYYQDSAHKFRIVGQYLENASGAVDVTPGYINFFDTAWNVVGAYRNNGFHINQNGHSYFETNHDDDTNITFLRIRGDYGNTIGTLDLTPGFIQFYDANWNVAAFLGSNEINQLKALLNHVQSASASWVNPSTATGSI